MRSYDIELPARRRAWLADAAYQVRLTEQARTLVAAAAQLRPAQLQLDAARMPDTHENAQLAERDEVRIHFAFRVTNRPVDQTPLRRGSRHAA